DVGQPLSAQPNQSPRDSDQQHFPHRVEHKSLPPIDRRRNKSTQNSVEKKRHRHERDDVDQITKPTRPANSSGMLDLVFHHPPDTYRLSDRHCKNRFRLCLRNWLAFTASRYCSPSWARARRRFARSADRREADPNPGAGAANHSLSYWAVVLPPPVALTQDPSHLSEHK